MSTKVSGGAAYQRLSYEDQGINQGLQFWGQMSARRGEEDRARDERETLRKSNEVKVWGEKYNLKPEDFQSKYTGFGSYDDMNRDYSQYNVQKYIDLSRQAKEAMLSGNNMEKNRLEGELIKRKNNFNLVKQGQDHFAVVYEDYKKMVEDQTISGSSKFFEDVMQAVIVDHNVAIREDDNGNPVYVGRTPEGDPFEIAHKDLMDGSFSPNMKQDIDGKEGIVNNILGTLGTITNTTEEGLTTITEQSWDDNVHGKAVDSALESIIGDDRSMADLLYQVTGGQEIKMTGFNQEDIDKVSNTLKQRIKASYDQEYEEKFNTSRARLGLDNRKFAESSNKQGSSKIEFEPVARPNGDLVGGNPLFSASDLPFEQTGGEFTLRTKGGKPIKGILEGQPDAELLTLTESDGEYYANVRITTQQRDDEGNKINNTVSKKVKLSDSEINRLARESGLPTGKDLKDNLDQRTKEYLNRTDTGSTEPEIDNNIDPLGLL